MRVAAGTFHFEVPEARIEHVADRWSGLGGPAVSLHSQIPSVAGCDVGNMPRLSGAFLCVPDRCTPDAFFRRTAHAPSKRAAICPAIVQDVGAKNGWEPLQLGRVDTSRTRASAKASVPQTRSQEQRLGERSACPIARRCRISAGSEQVSHAQKRSVQQVAHLARQPAFVHCTAHAHHPLVHFAVAD
jgi:hypothetical protein